MAGASGFLGTPARRAAARPTGTTCTRLVRRAAAAPPTRPPGTRRRASSTRPLVAGADAVINLAGAGVGDKRWTAGYKRAASASSRVDTTGTLARAIAAAARGRPAPRSCCSPPPSAGTATPATPPVRGGRPGRQRLPGRPVPGLGGRGPSRRGRRHTGGAAAHRPAAGRRRRAAQAAAAAVQAGHRRQAGQRPAVGAVDRAAGLARRRRCSCWTATTSPARSTWSARAGHATPTFTEALRPAAAPPGGHADPRARAEAWLLGEFAGEALRSQRVLPGVLRAGRVPRGPTPTWSRPCGLRWRPQPTLRPADVPVVARRQVAVRRDSSRQRPSVGVARRRLPRLLSSGGVRRHRPARRARRARRTTADRDRRRGPAPLAWHAVRRRAGAGLSVWLTHGLWRDPCTHAIADNVRRPGLLRVAAGVRRLHCCGHGARPVLHRPAERAARRQPGGQHVHHRLHGPVRAADLPGRARRSPSLTILTLNLAGAAFAWYLFLRRFVVRHRAAAAVAGLFCGFAPGFVSHANGHLNWSAGWIAPVLLWWVLKLREPGRWLRNGLILGAAAWRSASRSPPRGCSSPPWPAASS